MITGVYCILHEESGKMYIGSAAVAFRLRFANHRHLLRAGRHHSIHLQRAWNKYGESAFLFLIVELCPAEECVLAEQGWIDEFQTANGVDGYNISPTAGSPLGIKASAETRAKLSARFKGRVFSEEWKAKIRAAKATPESRAKRANRIVSLETRQKLSISSRRTYRPEARANMSRAQKGKYVSPETRAKIAATLRGSIIPQEVRDKLSQAMRGRKKTPEHQAKITESLRRFYATKNKG